MKLNWKHLLLLLLSAVLLGLSFAPFNQVYTAFFSLIPLLYVLVKTGKGFLTGLIWGLFYCIFSIHWLAFNTGTYPWVATFSMLLAALFLSLNYAVIGMLFTMIYRRDQGRAFLLFPVIWVAVEFVRSFGILGFPWLSLGHSQAYNTLYIQHADLGGVYLVSFSLLAANVLLFLLFRSFSRKKLAALLAAVLIPFLYGLLMINLDLNEDKTCQLRIVQPNIGAKEKWIPENRIPILQLLDSLSRAETGVAPDVIVWPETAVPYYLRASRYFCSTLSRCAADTRATLITGALDFFYTDSLTSHQSTNSLFLFEAENYSYSDIIYDKIHLVPFGEFTPGGKMFSWLNNMQYGQSNFTSRKNVRIPRMTADSIAFTPMICYDSVFPHTIRRYAAMGSKYNILITNDIWFGRSMGPHLHAAIALVRAVETRLPLIRSANAGISMFIDNKGRVIDSIPLYTRGIIEHPLAAGSYVPPYVKMGNTFSVLMLITALLGIVYTLCIKTKK